MTSDNEKAARARRKRKARARAYPGELSRPLVVDQAKLPPPPDGNVVQRHSTEAQREYEASIGDQWWQRYSSLCAPHGIQIDDPGRDRKLVVALVPGLQIKVRSASSPKPGRPATKMGQHYRLCMDVKNEKERIAKKPGRPPAREISDTEAIRNLRKLHPKKGNRSRESSQAAWQERLIKARKTLAELEDRFGLPRGAWRPPRENPQTLADLAQPLIEPEESYLHLDPHQSLDVLRYNLKKEARSAGVRAPGNVAKGARGSGHLAQFGNPIP